MPSKKKKYNARFPAGRIKKIMQTDEEVGKVAQAVPVIISRTLELFVESLLTKAMQITVAKNAKTLSPSHMKQCILSEQRFDFLKDLVNTVQDTSNGEEELCGSSTPSGHVHIPKKLVSERRKSSNSLTKEETHVIAKEETVTMENIEKREGAHPSHVVANCLKPLNFYTEIKSEQSISIEQPSLEVSPMLVMDEDYDT